MWDNKNIGTPVLTLVPQQWRTEQIYRLLYTSGMSTENFQRDFHHMQKRTGIVSLFFHKIQDLCAMVSFVRVNSVNKSRFIVSRTRDKDGGERWVGGGGRGGLQRPWCASPSLFWKRIGKLIRRTESKPCF